MHSTPVACLCLQGALSPVAELPVFKCNVTRYSHSGGLLAAAGGSNTIFVYPAYYGHEGAAGRASSNRPASQNRSAAAAAGSGDGSAVLEPVAVLKGENTPQAEACRNTCRFRRLHCLGPSKL